MARKPILMLWVLVVLFLLNHLYDGSTDEAPTNSRGLHPSYTTQFIASSSPLSYLASNNNHPIDVDRRNLPVVVECALSNFAKKSRFATKLHSLCGSHCFPKSKGLNLPPEPRPSFCTNNNTSYFPAARYEFSPTLGYYSSSSSGSKVVASPLPQTLPVIFCALGMRFYGPGGQSYVLEAIQQWRLFHSPSMSEVYLILHKTTLEKEEIQQFAKEFDVSLVEEESLWTPEWRRYFRVFYVQGYMHPGGSRQTGHHKFNQYVSERFFAVESLMRSRSLINVLHLEGDMMVYDNLLSVVHSCVRCGYRMATTFPHTKGAIPSVLFVKEPDDLSRFTTYMNDFLSCGEKFGEAITPGYANDMTYLMNYYQLFGSEYLAALPSWEHKEGENCVVEDQKRLLNPTKTSSSVREKKDEEEVHSDNSTEVASTHSSTYSLFDGASFGQWYSFRVAANRVKPPKHIRDAMRGRFVDATPPPWMRWVKHSLNSSLVVPMWKKYRLVTLHIHAKNLNAFRSSVVIENATEQLE